MGKEIETFNKVVFQKLKFQGSSQEKRFPLFLKCNWEDSDIWRVTLSKKKKGSKHFIGYKNVKCRNVEMKEMKM